MSDKEHEAYLTGIAENQSVVGHLRAQLDEAQQRLVESQEAKRLLNEQYTLLEAENKQIKSQLDAEQQRAVKAEAACASAPEWPDIDWRGGRFSEWFDGYRHWKNHSPGSSLLVRLEAADRLADSVRSLLSTQAIIQTRGPSNALDEALRKARLEEAEWWFSAEVIQDEETGKYTTTIPEMEKRLAALREQGKVGKS